MNTSFREDSGLLLQHRGPDQTSFVSETVNPDIELTFGQTRLNIVDRQDIALPIRVDSAVILFNGEIYNHPELRSELRSLGWEFKTNTDTEVALVSYLQWGKECLVRFNGMFALAIWDGKQFFCARDRMGKKPLFYRCRGNTFEIVSEVKVFSNLEFAHNEVFDLFEFCFDEFTLYRDIFSVRPGYYLVYNPLHGTINTRPYWSVEHQVDHKIENENEAIDTFIELLDDAIQLRLRADVPVSMFLSGGLDSALVASLSGVKEAFTCQFEEFAGSINEEKYAADLTQRLGMKLTVVRPTKEEFFQDLSALAYHLEIPTGSFSVFPLYRLAKACHQAGYKVVLSGEGSDELFAGYARNEFLLGDVRQFDDMKTQHYQSMLRRYDGTDLDRFCRMASRSGLAGAALLKSFLSQHWSEQKTMAENICYIESCIFIQPLLQMTDRMCMANSVEGRCPYLDHRMVEFAFSLDDRLRYRDGTGKWIVQKAAEKILPKGSLVLSRRVKHGLPTPVNLWVQKSHSFDRKHWNSLMTAECMKVFPRGPQ